MRPVRAVAGEEPANEDDFQQMMRHEADLRAAANWASSQHAPAPDQLEEWLKETSVPYAPDANFSQTGIFEHWHSKTSKYPI